MQQRQPTGNKKNGIITPLKKIEFIRKEDDLFSETKSIKNGDNFSQNGTFTNQFYN